MESKEELIIFTQKNNELATVKMTGKWNRREIVFFNEAYRIRDNENKSVFNIKQIIKQYNLHPYKTYQNLKEFSREFLFKMNFEYFVENKKNKQWEVKNFSFLKSLNYNKGKLTWYWNTHEIPQKILNIPVNENGKQVNFFQIPTALVNKFKNINTIKLIELFKTKVFAGYIQQELVIPFELLITVMNRKKNIKPFTLKRDIKNILYEINKEPLSFLFVRFLDSQTAEDSFTFFVEHKTNQYGKTKRQYKTARPNGQPKRRKTKSGTEYTSAAQIIQDRLANEQHFNDLEEKKRQEFLQGQNKTEKIKSDPISKNEKQRLQEITNTAENSPKTTHIAKQQPSPSKDPTYNKATPLAALFPEKEKPTQPNMYNTQDVATFLEEKTPASDKILFDTVKKLSKTDPERFKQLIKKIG